MNIINGKSKLSNNGHNTIVVIPVEIEGKVVVVILFYTNIQIKGKERITHCAVRRSGRKKKLSHVVDEYG